MSCVMCTIMFLNKRISLVYLSQERWDPTEILASPFPLDVLRFVVFTSCRSIMTPNEFMATTIWYFYKGKYKLKDLDQATRANLWKRTIKYLVMMAVLTVILFCISILCGASPFANVHHSLLASFYVATLGFGYIQPKADESIQMAIKRVIVVNDYHELPFIDCLVNEMNGYVLYSVVAVTVPFMILNVLDGGFQIQRWPLPIILGSFCGHIIGITLGTLLGVYRLYRMPRKREMTPSLTSPPKDRMA
jgi:GPI biosynthesis protein family Pig-F.